ncbi:MAG: hypothetical protein LBQ02_00165 [Candidatus Nomurabacteria bacterium]|nr:hypothetical protein [Candidatus Nomurabacteria bacterium]
MASGSNCKATGLDRRYCYCWECVKRRNNAVLRSGNNNQKRKSTNPHNDGLKGNRGNGGGKKK